jgi:uncharacterized membrane protein HdeD (DUF308 family)
LSGVFLLVAGGSAAMVAGVISLAAGIIVLIFPLILNYVVGIYLIAIGAIALAVYAGLL